MNSIQQYNRYYSDEIEFYHNKNSINWTIQSNEPDNFSIYRNDQFIINDISSFLENKMRITYSVEDDNLYILFSEWYYIFENIRELVYNISFVTKIENNQNVDLENINTNNQFIKWSKRRNYFSR
ncbi:MAG: hypothetical protein KC589_06740 [Nanoarchaeota archaeon]|nr:hypothetical protein [Nanoarchaeota archaeon]